MQVPSCIVASHLRRTFRALELPAYRLFAFAQLGSIIGTIAQGIGCAWLVLRLHGGGVALGLVSATQFAPLLIAGPLGGVVADHYDKRRLLLGTQTGMALTASALAAFAISGHITVLGIALLGLVQGAFGAVDNPVRGALVAELVGVDRLANAVSLQEVWINTARVVGPLVGGALIATFGVGACFVLNAASFVPVVVAVWFLAPAPPSSKVVTSRRALLLEGVRYAWTNRAFRGLLVLAATIGTFFNFGVVLPLLARDVFHGGPETLGGMIAAVGAGAIVGSLVLASRGDPTPRRLETLGILSAFLLAVDAAAPGFHTELVALAFTGAAGVSLVAVGGALLQLRCAPAVRGRLVALWSVAIVGTTVVSGPTVGFIAARTGPRIGMATVGLAVLLATLIPRADFRTLAVNSKGAFMPTLDRRTKDIADVHAVMIDDLIALNGNAVIAARAQHLLDLPPLTIEVNGTACTIDEGTVRRGTAPDAVRVAVDAHAMGDLVAGLRTTSGLLFLGGAELPDGGHQAFAAWDHVLRALWDGVPVYEPGTLTFASPDLAQVFTPDDQDADIAAFIADAGFAHLRGWIDPALLPQIHQEVMAAAEVAKPGDPYRWWARLEGGTERCVRVMHVLDVSPTMAALVAGPTYERLGRLFDDGHRRFPENPQSSEALIKPLGVVSGIAEFPWHRDCSLGGHDFRCAGYAIGLPLSATNEEAGQLRVAAGSHRASTPGPADLPVVEINTQPGDLTIHVGCTLHGTRPPSTAERAVVYTSFGLLPLNGRVWPTHDGAMPDLERVAAAQ